MDIISVELIIASTALVLTLLKTIQVVILDVMEDIIV